MGEMVTAPRRPVKPALNPYCALASPRRNVARSAPLCRMGREARPWFITWYAAPGNSMRSGRDMRGSYYGWGVPSLSDLTPMP